MQSPQGRRLAYSSLLSRLSEQLQHEAMPKGHEAACLGPNLYNTCNWVKVSGVGKTDFWPQGIERKAR